MIGGFIGVIGWSYRQVISQNQVVVAVISDKIVISGVNLVLLLGSYRMRSNREQANCMCIIDEWTGTRDGVRTF
jgi:hypothetical protein